MTEPLAGPPPAPWTCRCEAVLWLTLPRTLGGLVRYLDTPVGPYHEVFAARAVGLGRGTIGFMAVDSEPSLAGGRGNWALPKEMARFERGTVTGGGWEVAVRARAARGPALPVAGVAVLVQGGRSARLEVRGRGRPALVRVAARGTPLRPGRFPGLVLETATFTLGVPV